MIVTKPAATTIATSSVVLPRLSIEEQFARVAETSPTAMALTGSDGLIKMVNRQLEYVFGYGRAELYGRPLNLLLSECFHGCHSELQIRCLSNMSSRMTGEGWGLYGLRKDGTEFRLEIGVSPINLDSEPMVFLTDIVDVTERQTGEGGIEA